MIRKPIRSVHHSRRAGITFIALRVIRILYRESILFPDTGVDSKQHSELAERIANQIAGAIANAELFAQQREAEEEIRDLAKFPSENPSPVLRVAGDGKVMYANGEGERFLHLQGLGVGEPAPVRFLRMVEEALGSGMSAEDEFEFGDRVFAFVSR